MQPADPFPPAQLDRVSAARTDPAALAELWARNDAQRVAIRDGAIAIGAAEQDSGQPVIGEIPDSLAAAPADRRVLLASIRTAGPGGWCGPRSSHRWQACGGPDCARWARGCPRCRRKC